VDLVATIYSRGGVRAPEPLDGHDLTPLLGNPARSNWNHPVVQSYTRMGFGEKTAQVWRSRSPVGPPVPWWVSVVQGHYKYVRTMVRGEVEELYDLREDPEELVNLALRKQDAKLLDEMRTTLDRELKRTNAPFVNRMPDTGTSAALAKAERAVHPGPGSGLKAIFGRHSDRVNRPETGRVSKPGRLFGKSLVQAAKPGKRACLGLKS
jgi:hypothetical protein